MFTTDQISTAGLAAEQRGALSYVAFVNEYLKPLRPAVITDAIRNWRSLSVWTPEFLRSEFMKGEANRDVEKSALFDALHGDSSVAGSAASHVWSAALAEAFPHLIPDIQPALLYATPNWLTTECLPASVRRPLNERCWPTLHIGARGAVSLHREKDIYHRNLFFSQIYGSQEFDLFPPEHPGDAYPRATSGNASRLKAVLAPGHSLFIPAGWSYATRLTTPSIAIASGHANAANWRQVARRAGEQARAGRQASNGLRKGMLPLYFFGVQVARSLIRS